MSREIRAFVYGREYIPTTLAESETCRLLVVTDNQIEVLRSLVNYAHQRRSWNDETIDAGRYYMPSDDDWDDIEALVSDLEDKLMSQCDFVTLDDVNKRVGINCVPVHALDVLGGWSRFSNLDTNLTTKSYRWLSRHYDTSEEDPIALLAQSTSTENELHHGGGSSVQNAATAQYFYTSVGTKQLNGNQRMVIGNSTITLTGYADATQLAVNSYSSLTLVTPLVKFVINTGITNAINTAQRLTRNCSSTPIAGFGVAQDFFLKTSTTIDTQAARIAAVWNSPTHGAQVADLVLSAWDTSEREIMRGRGAGAAGAVGFLGATPVARQTVGAACTDLDTAVALINQLRAALIAFGFCA